MRIVKKILIGLVLLVVALLVVSLFLPSAVSVARSTSIAAPPEAVFPFVNDLKKTNEWSPWVARDPDMRQTFEGPGQGVGTKATWQSDHPDVGSGSQEIIESVENQKVRVALDFGEQGIATAGFLLEPVDDGTKVTWHFETELGFNPVMRYMGLMFDTWIGAEYETGLASLKTLVERGDQ